MIVDLNGATSVIIGGNQGIGAAIATGLARSGSRVVLAARDEQRLAEASADIKSGPNAGVVVTRVDVTSVDSIRSAAEELETSVGVPRILVNSAGGTLRKRAFEVSPEEWNTLLDTHLRGTFFSCQAFGRGMADAGYGKIINLSSTWSSTVAPERSVYATAKAGVSHLTSALATEWAPLGIRVNAIAPTATTTPRVMERLSRDESSADFALSRIPLGRLARPEDVVGAALFLSGPESDFITGHTLYVDGGWRASK